MTLVRLRGRVPGFGQLEALPSGVIAIERWSSDGPASLLAGQDYIPDTILRTAIVDGEPTNALEILPTDGSFCIRWTITATGADHSGTPLIRFTTIPDVESIDFADLPDVDPATYAPLSPLPPSAQEILDTASDAAAGAAEDATDARAARIAAETARTAAETARASAETASTTATGARDVAVQAKTDAQAARDAATSSAQDASGAATGAATSAGNAASSATAAANSASTAAASATDAALSKTTAADSATTAAASASSASNSATAAAAARTGAETAKTTAESAQAGAETARTDAQAACAGAETAKTGAESARTAAESARTGAETARDVALAGQFAGSLIPSTGVDLNTLTNPGVYRFGTSAMTASQNGPANRAGLLEVHYINGPTTPMQRFIPYGSPQQGIYLRWSSSGGWLPWSFIPIQRVDQTAGRAIYTFDPLNNREQLIYGDTGWRGVSGPLLNGWTMGSYRIRRVGSVVSLVVGGLNGSAATNPQWEVFPEGFRPFSTEGGLLFFEGNSPTSAYRSYIGGSGQATVGTPIPAVNIGGSMTWLTAQPWPTSLPGTALGGPA